MAESVPSNLARIKKALVDSGFEVFRSRGDEIILAERPRENLIMDSGVRLRIGDGLEVLIVLRAQKADFPNEDEASLFDRVRRLADSAVADGFVEVAAAVSPVLDPSDAKHTLDTFYEITYSKHTPTFDAAIVQLKVAISLEKRAEPQLQR